MANLKIKIQHPLWTIAAPILAWILFAGKGLVSGAADAASSAHGAADATSGHASAAAAHASAAAAAPGAIYTFLLAAALIASVLAAVHFAEAIAHRIGEPFGALILAVAVTSIEVALIISLMLTPGHETATLARDTVFAAEMIIITGIVGGCLLLGGVKFKEQTFGLDGVSAALVVLTAISVLTLILPNYTSSTPGPFYNNKQLAFVAIVSLILYGTFLLIQTVSHRAYFLQEDAPPPASTAANPAAANPAAAGNPAAANPQATAGNPAHPTNHPPAEAPHPTNLTTILSVVFLLVSLAAVVVLAEYLAPGIESGVDSVGAPRSLVGIIIAMVVLLPECLSALNAAKNNQLQSSLNLALGSALASIGLTIPAVAFVALYKGLPLTLGIDTKSTVLFLLSLFIILLSLRTGRTTLLQGVVLLVIFAVYIFTTIVP
jgi:Ca2+:H+ antiporter